MDRLSNGVQKNHLQKLINETDFDNNEGTSKKIENILTLLTKVFPLISIPDVSKLVLSQSAYLKGDNILCGVWWHGV